MPPSSRPRLMLPAIEEAQKCLEIQHKGATSPPRTMLSLRAAHRLICSDSFLCPPVCADLVFFFSLRPWRPWTTASPISSPTWWIWTWSSSACGMGAGFLLLVVAVPVRGRVGWGRVSGWGVLLEGCERITGAGGTS